MFETKKEQKLAPKRTSMLAKHLQENPAKSGLGLNNIV